jgi:2-polyprenyl-3-methyl-5-hydroxy-6-metoxy-1,4-benzoquinol methylase
MDPEYTKQYERFERLHWWHVARRELIHRFLDTYATVSGNGDPRWLDIGCGTGVLLESYQRLKNKIGVEMDAASVVAGRAKGLEIQQISRTWDLASYSKFDLVTLCDVIEHVEDDAGAIREVGQVLNDHGIVLITVPALMSLWSNHDVVNHHYRRYNRRQLLALFPSAQWEVLRVSYFCSFLLPMVWGVRKVKNLVHGVGAKGAQSDFKMGLAPVDRTLLAIFRTEGLLMRLTNLPLGSSLIIVARRK